MQICATRTWLASCTVAHIIHSVRSSLTLRLFLTVCLATGLLTAAVAPVEADVIAVGDSVKFSDAPGTTGGGEFIATINDAESFITFCLQRTEHIDFTTSFEVTGISKFAMTDPAGKGGDAVTGHDPIRPETAWLYQQFRAEALDEYDYLGPDRWKSANALQNAIWWFEGEIASNPNNVFVTAALAAVADGWSGVGRVRVMNLAFPNGREAQDQLVLVPEPSSLALLFSAASVALWRRQRTRRD
jgi:hypothetical protein